MATAYRKQYPLEWTHITNKIMKLLKEKIVIPSMSNNLNSPYLENNNTKKGWWSGSTGKAPA
jgi:hypothetical protein